MQNKNSTVNMKRYSLTIGWLYPDLMSTYGDRGNITVLQKRCLWRGIDVTILPINQQTTPPTLRTVDLLFGGGAQDIEQGIVMKDLRKKGEQIKSLIEGNTPALFVCGSPQLMGTYYEPSEGERIEGLGIFDMISKHPGPAAKRLIGNTVGKVYWENLNNSKELSAESLENKSSEITKLTPTLYALRSTPYIVGFENHGGRSYLGKHAKPFAKVIKGNGNNGEDHEEGVVYKNAIGCYYHGPLLPKNPHIADWLIQTALVVKYNESIELTPLDDTLEYTAMEAIAKKLHVRL